MISAIYLLKRGVDINKKDVYGNTTFGIALLYQHSNLAIVLMQNQCDINSFLIEPDTEVFEKEIKEREK